MFSSIVLFLASDEENMGDNEKRDGSKEKLDALGTFREQVEPLVSKRSLETSLDHKRGSKKISVQERGKRIAEKKYLDEPRRHSDEKGGKKLDKAERYVISRRLGLKSKYQREAEELDRSATDSILNTTEDCVNIGAFFWPAMIFGLLPFLRRGELRMKPSKEESMVETEVDITESDSEIINQREMSLNDSVKETSETTKVWRGKKEKEDEGEEDVDDGKKPRNDKHVSIFLPPDQQTQNLFF